MLFCLALWIVGGNAAANDCALQARATYRNPILDADFPDPTVIETRHGWYFAYATQILRAGKRINVQVSQSRDLINWQPPNEAMPEKPRWASQTWNFWAPHVSVHNGIYYLYFSAQPDTPVAPTGFGRVGGDQLNPKLRHGTVELRWLVAVDLATGFRG